ncbi:uncharacterized protein [Spinacia oleracea]|uniref:RNase H type-1 domain-containing protein n=1 Tax=Spinacia oleracea TaxID=3562 RepID=A0ABM3RBT1_SPIOL|nr:uncharacterized protein LOC130467945 [Spinacia oleracea]
MHDLNINRKYESEANSSPTHKNNTCIVSSPSKGKNIDGKGGLWEHKKHWIPPAEGFMKLNIDGAWKSNIVSGGGGVFRRHTGSWFVGFSSKFAVHSPLAAELYALCEGLKIAKDLMIDKLEVETDAMNLKLLLGKVQNQVHHELGPVLREVAILLSQNWTVSFKHIPKIYNKVAHSLAAHSWIMAVGHKLHYIIPSCAKDDYESDFEKVNPEYVEEIRRNAHDQAMAIVGERVGNQRKTNKDGASSSASEIVFGSIVSTIKQVVGSSTSTDVGSKDKGKLKAFTPFIVGGSKINKDIEIVEVEDDEEDTTVTNK